jgi:hypothetical protein
LESIVASFLSPLLYKLLDLFFLESINIHGMNWILNPFHCQLLKLHYMSGDNMSSGGGGGFVA